MRGHFRRRILNYCQTKIVAINITHISKSYHMEQVLVKRIHHASYYFYLFDSNKFVLCNLKDNTRIIVMQTSLLFKLNTL